MSATREVQSRRPHRCAGGVHTIPAGELHLLHEPAPGDPRDWMPMRECLTCAARNGRGPLADPETAEQPLDLAGIA